MNTSAPVLTADQAEAAALIEEWFYHLNTQIFVLCGYAGTGKTFLVDYVVRDMGLVPGESAVFVAPTGKAASVLIRAGVPAGTVHSLIYTREEDIEVDENGEVISERFLRFVKKEKIDGGIRLIVWTRQAWFRTMCCAIFSPLASSACAVAIPLSCRPWAGATRCSRCPSSP